MITSRIFISSLLLLISFWELFSLFSFILFLFITKSFFSSFGGILLLFFTSVEYIIFESFIFNISSIPFKGSFFAILLLVEMYILFILFIFKVFVVLL